MENNMILNNWNKNIYYYLYYIYSIIIIIYIINLNIMFPTFLGSICNCIKKMNKLLVITSHMSFMTNG
jgi:hypothetical protein